MKLLTRRELLAASLKYGAALTLMSSFPYLFANQIKFDEHEQIGLQANADYELVFGSPYDSENWRFSPHMHHEFKKNVQEMSNGRIYVDIQDKGAVGIGPKLMVNIVREKITVGLVSMSNLVPIAPELDLLNIPFWSADNQSYVNLVTSDIWKSMVLDKIKDAGKLEVLFHYVVGPRTAASTKSHHKLIKTPADLKGIRFRVPASNMLALFYSKLAGAVARKIAWGKTAEAARLELFEALDSSIIGLFNGPDNLNKELAYISQIKSVHDGWAAVISKPWLDKLPNDLREILHLASEKTFREQIIKVEKITAACLQLFELQGTQVYTPTKTEQQAWVEQCGHTRPEWTPFKKDILGDVKIFDKLIEATHINNGYNVG